MWQVWQASGRRASAFEKRWRVWHASQEALPNGRRRPCASSACSAGGLEAELVAAAAALQPLADGDRLVVEGRHRLHRRPRERVLALLELRDLRVVALRAGVGGRAASPSRSRRCVLCAAPWQASQPTSIAACRESSQSFTMFGFTFAWQVTQALRRGGLRGRLAVAASSPPASCRRGWLLRRRRAARTASAAASMRRALHRHEASEVGVAAATRRAGAARRRRADAATAR